MFFLLCLYHLILSHIQQRDGIPNSLPFFVVAFEMENGNAIKIRYSANVESGNCLFVCERVVSSEIANSHIRNGTHLSMPKDSTTKKHTHNANGDAFASKWNFP